MTMSIGYTVPYIVDVTSMPVWDDDGMGTGYRAVVRHDAVVRGTRSAGPKAMLDYLNYVFPPAPGMTRVVDSVKFRPGEDGDISFGEDVLECVLIDEEK